MSLSKENRTENIELALILIFKALGSQSIRMFPINRSDPRYSDVFPTTWLELIQRGHVSDSKMRPFYVLTATGWTACLELNGILEHSKFKEVLGVLCANLKNALDGRHQQAIASVADIARISGLDEGVISNIIDARLIEQCLNRYGAEWVPKLEGKLLRVPANFGLERM